VVQDYAEAVKWYRLAAAQGHAAAQSNLGTMYVNGQGVVQDYAEAVKWYRLAAAQGHAAAQSNLGTMYVNGQGVVQDYVRAHMWFNLGAVSGKAEKATSNRDSLAAKMTPAQIAEAQKIARECQARSFKDC
jgi:TPR repeat protein